MVKNLPDSTGDARNSGSIPGSGSPPGGGSGNPLQYSCLEKSMYRGAWQARVHRIAKTQTWLSMHVWTLNHPKKYINIIISIWQNKLWRRKWQPTPVFVPGEFHGQKSLVVTGGVRQSVGSQKSDTTEQLTLFPLATYCQHVLSFPSTKSATGWTTSFKVV